MTDGDGYPAEDNHLQRRVAMNEERNQASKHQDKAYPQEPVYVSRGETRQHRADLAEFDANMSSGERNKRTHGTDLNSPELQQESTNHANQFKPVD